MHSSRIFHDTPESDLVELAGALEELHLDADVQLFAKGDHGDSMYFVYKGNVRIHDEEHTFANLGENEILGELSILDAEPRSATATTTEQTILLKLEREPFYEIMISNAEVLKGILKTLCKRLRQMDILLVESRAATAAD